MSNFDQVAHGVWDVVVVGAGPAGALAARQLVLNGAQVLLVDRAPLGRRKVCGCCLNTAAIHTLDSVNLHHLAESLGAIQLRCLEVAAGRCQARVPLPSGVSLSREAFDAALIHQAVAGGATFFAETNASLGPPENNCRQVLLTQGTRSLVARARVVLAADGLGCKLLAGTRQTGNVVQAGSRIGAGVVLPRVPSWIESGTIYIACSRHGYVGLVVLENGRLNVAAAFDRNAVRKSGGPGPLATDILAEVGWNEITGLRHEQWQGTMMLTQRAERLWDERVLVLGDAAGYIEPFTGEGMAWALASAVAGTPAALAAADHWSPRIGAEWERVHQQTVVQRQVTCRILARALRHPWLVRMAIRLLSVQPALARPVVRRVSVG